MTKEEKWIYIRNEMLKAIETVQAFDKETEIMKLSIQYAIFKLIENEDTMNESLITLDRYNLVKKR
jgi:hypothetical protein